MKYEWNIPLHATEEGAIYWVQEDLNIPWWFLTTGHLPCFHDQQYTHDGSWTEGSGSHKLHEPHVSSVPLQERCEEWHMHPEAGEWNGIQDTEIYLPGLQIFIRSKASELRLRKALSWRYEREGHPHQGENVPEKKADIFRTIGRIIISHETVRKTIPLVPVLIMESSGYFVYDEQYVWCAPFIIWTLIRENI